MLAHLERQAPMPASTAMAPNASALSNGKRAAEDDEMGPDGKKICPGISASIVIELTDCNAALSQQRKKRQTPPTLVPLDAIERYTQLNSYLLYKTNKAGILSIHIHQSKDLIATGGVDTNVVVFNRSSGEIVSTHSGHSKKVFFTNWSQVSSLYPMVSWLLLVQMIKQLECGKGLKMGIMIVSMS